MVQSEQIERVKNLVVQKYPKIDRSILRITSPQDESYNCIAYAGGDETRWWWPDINGFAYWPISLRVETLPCFQAAFEKLGYKLCASEDLEQDFEKIAIFSLGSAPTHAAKQLDNGVWSSKLGKSFDISHDLHGIENEEYGKVAFVMKRHL